MRRIIMLLTAAVVIVWAGVAWLLLAPAGAQNGGSLSLSGTLEAKQVAVVAEVAGQVARLPVREGDAVQAGAVLVELDTAMQDAQIARAEAAVEAARANLAQVQAGARSEQLDRARSALDREIAARDGAERAVKDLQAILGNPQDLDAQIATTQAQLKAAEAAVTQAQNQRRAAEIVRDRYQGQSSPEGRAQFQAADAQVRAADAGIQAALANRDGVQNLLNLLVAMRANPLSLKSQLHAAQARLSQAEASVLMARAELDGLLAGPRPEEVAVAQAGLEQAQAALEQLRVQRQKMTLTAPISGQVAVLSVHGGENVQPGSKLMTLANLDDMRLTLYVPETQVGHVQVGQSVQVTVDGLPGRRFTGRVYFISPRAEFTPSAVQTKDERAKTVFMVKVRVDNPDHALKPGMPADAVVQVSNP